MSFRFANVDGSAALVDGDGRWFDAARVSGGELDEHPMAAWRQLDALHAAASRLHEFHADGHIDDCVLGPPIPAPKNVFGVGLNYRSHAAESKMEPPSSPLVFTKFPSCITGPRDAVVLGGTTDDYEAELVVVIGRGGRDISREEAWGHVGGLTIGQDISDRTLQFASQPPHFDLGKSRDTYGPIGPIVVSPDTLADPGDVLITCEVNGERRQEDRSTGLIFDVPTLVSYLSGVLTLSPGDLIFTGTPEGVGATTQRFLRPGDTITTTIEGIGTMINRCDSR